MIKELKFSLDLRAGDSKPINKGGGSKSLLDDESPYGDIDEDTKSKDHTKKDDSAYAVFNDNYSTTKSSKSKA